MTRDQGRPVGPLWVFLLFWNCSGRLPDPEVFVFVHSPLLPDGGGNVGNVGRYTAAAQVAHTSSILVGYVSTN